MQNFDVKDVFCSFPSLCLKVIIFGWCHRICWLKLPENKIIVCTIIYVFSIDIPNFIIQEREKNFLQTSLTTHKNYFLEFLPFKKVTLYTFVGCIIPSLGLKHWQFLTPQKKNECDLKHLPSDDINIYGQRYLSIWKGHFKGFKDSTVMNIHRYKELQHFKLKIHFPNTLKSVNVKISETWNVFMAWLERRISNNSSYFKDR